ncbi:hypothetical protein Hanom_Chr14g01263501 [Helianthus anomalus]
MKLAFLLDTRVIIGICVFCLLAAGSGIYASIGFFVMQTTVPTLGTVNINEASASFLAETPEVRIALQVGFDISGGVRVKPELGTIILSSVVGSDRITSTTYCVFDVSNHNQVIKLDFQITGTTTQKLQKAGESIVWLKLDGQFKAYVKLLHFPFFPEVERSINFECDLSFINSHFDILNFQSCFAT